jgi:hypothetical protein
VSDKKSHKEAHYVKRSPHPKKYCGNCFMFRRNSAYGCTLVASPIHYDGYCVYWEPERKESMAA